MSMLELIKTHKPDDIDQRLLALLKLHYLWNCLAGNSGVLSRDWQAALETAPMPPLKPGAWRRRLR